MASILDSPHIHKRRGGGGRQRIAEPRETMMMMMHMAKISPLALAATVLTAITVWIR